MKNHRIGNDINVKWSIFSEGAPYNLEGLQVTLYLKDALGKRAVTGFSLQENNVLWRFAGKDQAHTGRYSLELVVNEGETSMITTDVCNFVNLVQHSCMIGGSDASNIETDSISLTSDLGSVPVIIDKSLSEVSENAIANKTVTKELKKKVNKTDLATINGQSITKGGDIVIKGPDLNEYAKKEELAIIHGDTENSAVLKGGNNIAGKFATALGIRTKAHGDMSFTEGCNTEAKGANSHAEGVNTIAGYDGDWYIPDAADNIAGAYSHAEGNACVAKGSASHAEGKQTFAANTAAHAEGENNTVWGVASHIEGRSNSSTGNYNHVEGYHNNAQNDAEHASGKYNKSVKSTDPAQATSFSHGIGTSESDRRNAFEVKQNGDVYVKGIGGYDGTNAEEATDLSAVLNTINEYSITNTTYSELKSLRDNSQLIPGQQYKFLFRSVVSSNYISDEQSFYLIVTAETENTFSNKAKAERDTTAQNNTEAFNNSKFSEWEIWYDIDNNTDKYDWATDSGLGVIYRMIDEYGNDVYYDFKNIRRKRDDRNAAYLFTQIGNMVEDGGRHILEPVDESIELSVLGYFINNKVENIYNSDENIYIYSINIFCYDYSTNKALIKNNTIAIDFPVSNTSGNDVVIGVLGNNNYVSVVSGSSDVLFGTFIDGDNNKLNGVVCCTVDGSYNTIGQNCGHVCINGSYNVFGNMCYDIKIIARDTGKSRNAYNWKFGDNCMYLLFTSKSSSNIIHNVHVTDCTGNVGQFFEYQIEPNSSTSEITNIYLDTTDNTLKSYRGDRFGITMNDAVLAAKTEAFGVIIIDLATNEFYMSNPSDGEMAPLLVWMMAATAGQKRRGIGVHYVLEDGIPGYTSGNIFIDKTSGVPTLQFTAEGYTYTSVAEDYSITSFTKEPVKLADWSAKEGEEGYIKNKPFGLEYYRGDLVQGVVEMQIYYDIYLRTSYNDIVHIPANFRGQFKINDGPPVYVEIAGTPSGSKTIQLLDNYGYFSYLDVYAYANKINDVFISDTIARKSDIDSAISNAITNELNGDF